MYPALPLQNIYAACSFLENLYNPTLGLVRTAPDTNTYYIASDNILTASALYRCSAYSASVMSQNITQTIRPCCKTGYDYKHEILLGQLIPIPIHNPNIYTIANSSSGRLFNNASPATAGTYTILWEVDNATSVTADCAYADIAVYTALQLKNGGDTTGSQHEIDCLNFRFDGRGFADEAYKGGSQPGVYQTYKLALCFYAQRYAGFSISGPFWQLVP